MQATTERKSARIVRGETTLIVPHANGEATFSYPQVGPNTYQEVGKEILNRSLSVPTGDYTAYLVYSAYCDADVKNEPEFKSIRDIMKNRWLWVFNVNLWTDKGVYSVQDLKAEGLFMNMDINDLERRLKPGVNTNGIRFSEDESIRFAPKGLYSLGDHTPDSLSKDGFIIASFGEEGAKKIAEASSKFNYNPRTYGIDISEGNKPIKRVSALVDGLNGSRLRFNGNDFDSVRGGGAFGVRKEVAHNFYSQ